MRISRSRSLRASSVWPSSLSARTVSPPARCWITSVVISTPSSRDGSRSRSASSASSTGWPTRSSSTTVAHLRRRRLVELARGELDRGRQREAGRRAVGEHRATSGSCATNRSRRLLAPALDPACARRRPRATAASTSAISRRQEQRRSERTAAAIAPAQPSTKSTGRDRRAARSTSQRREPPAAARCGAARASRPASARRSRVSSSPPAAARRQLGAAGGAADVDRDARAARASSTPTSSTSAWPSRRHQPASRIAALAPRPRSANSRRRPRSPASSSRRAIAPGSAQWRTRPVTRRSGAERLGLEARDRGEPERLAPVRGDDRDLGDAAAAVGVAVDLHDHVDRAVDLVAQRLERDLQVAHRGERLEPVDRVVGRVGVDRDQRALVARVERLEHVERLAAADLADDDPVGAHAQRVAHQVADRDLAAALDVRRPRLERTTCGCWSRSSALSSTVMIRSPAGTAAESALSSVVLPAPVPPEITTLSLARTNARSSALDRRVERAHADELLEREQPREAADRDRRPVQRERRDDHVDALAAWAAGRRPSGSTRRRGG